MRSLDLLSRYSKFIAITFSSSLPPLLLLPYPLVRIASELFLITPICHLTLAKFEESNTFIRKVYGSDFRVSLTSCVFPRFLFQTFNFYSLSLSLVFSHLRGNILILIFRLKRSSNKSLNLRISRTQPKKIYTLFLPPTLSLVVGSFGNRCRRLLEPSRRLPKMLSGGLP